MDAAPTAADAGLPACAHAAREIADGVTVERVKAEPGDPRRGCVTLVRIDPAKQRLRVLNGEARPLDEWLRAEGALGGINASMYMPGGQSTGILYDAETVDRERDNPQMGAFLAFDPVDAKRDAEVAMFGRGCDGFELAAVRKRYRGLVQNYRIFDCDGRAIAWKDEKVYSTAAVAVDRAGRVVFVHSRTPWLMRDFTAWLAAPELGLAAAMYVEGGPEASLVVRESAGGDALAVREVGSYETGFHDGSNGMLWAIPNVLAFTPR